MLKIMQDNSTGYSNRTKQNASGRITIAIAADFGTAGEKLTAKVAKEHSVAFRAWRIDNLLDCIELHSSMIVSSMKKYECFDLNIAGNGIYTFSRHGYTQNRLNKIMYDLLKGVIEKIDIKSIRSGGQTGMDLAGLVAGNALGINCEALYPKNFKIRFEDGKDIFLTEEKIYDMIVSQAKVLRSNYEY